jgi:NRAMP (natural resistance-associated macrophage protein)-like metal ion transporter
VFRRSALVALAAVVGPGLLAGLSDDDPPGITTYSILGADEGYRLLWVLLLSTAALIVFHDLAARVGVVTGQGLAGIVRERYGIRIGFVALLALVLANLGTTGAEFAGVAVAGELAGIPRSVSVPVAALACLSSSCAEASTGSSTSSSCSARWSSPTSPRASSRGLIGGLPGGSPCPRCR